ncbi:MAG: fumarate hydratase [Endomicrobiaceae bacterium]|nr:fumarate hydratase [Endomicrobiaceae bacterium]
MRQIKKSDIILKIENLCADINYDLSDDVLCSIQKNIKNDNSFADTILMEIIENAKIAKYEKIALCQDTGTANVFVKCGKNVCFSDNSDIYSIINEGVKNGYQKYHLRKSIVADPIERMNTQTNTPANIYVDFVEGDKIEVTMLAKGGGSENASALKMLTPADGWKGIRNFIVDTVKEKGANACPPLIIGVGIGGDFASVGLVAKKALLRDIGSKNTSENYIEKENELLSEINKLNIGIMGLGGKCTALAVFIETKPCHIASLPVAVNLQCHSHRKKTIII